jgi:hypothetical protein
MSAEDSEEPQVVVSLVPMPDEKSEGDVELNPTVKERGI